MFASSSAAPLALMLFAGSSAAAQSRLPDCEGSPSRLELTAEPTGKVQEVCMSPQLPITFFFDTPLAPGVVELQGRERFDDVSTGSRSFTVFPPADLQTGERFTVGVRFADGAAPASAAFVLVGHPALGMRRVNVFRLKRTVEDYQREAQEERGKSQQLSQELERMRLQTGLGGLTGLIASGLMAIGAQEGGVKAEERPLEIIKAPSDAVRADTVTSYRVTTREKGVVRVAVAVKVYNPGTRPWALQGAVLLGKDQKPKQMMRWQSAPLPPDMATGVVVVEMDLTVEEAREAFTLKLWDQTGTRLVTLRNVTFP